MTSSTENNILWNSLVGLAILVGCGVTILIIGKERYLPELYVSHHTIHPAEDTSSVIHNSLPMGEEHSKADTVIESLPKPETTTATLNIADSKYVLVAGSFLSEERALKFISDLKNKVENVSPEIIPVTQNQSTYYRVVVRHANTISEMKDWKKEIERAGYADSWIYKN